MRLFRLFINKPRILMYLLIVPQIIIIIYILVALILSSLWVYGDEFSFEKTRTGKSGGYEASLKAELLKVAPPGSSTDHVLSILEDAGAKCDEFKKGVIICRYSTTLLPHVFFTWIDPLPMEFAWSVRINNVEVDRKPVSYEINHGIRWLQ